MGIDPDVSIELTRVDQQLEAISAQAVTRGERVTELADTIAALGVIVSGLDSRIEALESGATDPDPPSWSPKFPGDVQSGQARWGAAIGGNGDPVPRHEDIVGRPMGVRRTFYAWKHIGSGYLMNTVRDDHAHGRLPWVSIKPPSPQGGTSNGWASITAGHHDADLDQLLLDLDGSGKPTWLTMHHEPENDGLPAADWRAMQVKTRERIDATGVTNVGFAGILMGWTFDPRSGRNPADWWVDGAWDFIGLDPYMDKTGVRLLDPAVDVVWGHTLPYLRDKGLPYALGEWGTRGTGDDVRYLYDSIIADDQFIAACAFDSGLNAPSGSWELTGDQLTAFREAMADPRSLTLD